MPLERLTAAAVQQARGADRPCWGAQDRSNFDERFPDLSLSLSQGGGSRASRWAAVNAPHPRQPKRRTMVVYLLHPQP
jgi:hypothetical protein